MWWSGHEPHTNMCICAETASALAASKLRKRRICVLQLLLLLCSCLSATTEAAVKCRMRVTGLTVGKAANQGAVQIECDGGGLQIGLHEALRPYAAKASGKCL
jgi:hypothetical protein